MSGITLSDLNFYHSFLKESVISKLKDIQKDVDYNLIDKLVQDELSHKMKNEKSFKQELESLYHTKKQKELYG